ncbi:MAG: ATP-dependent DNA ligase [Candidatus Bathyarchaeota archaeon]|nr:ATP-dependent DNA ligase [Candidatus Bathyarchaeota archaeon]
MQTEFRALAELCEKLETTSKRTLMVGLVAEFLKYLHADEVEPATSMILGRPFPKWDQRTLEVSWATMNGLIKRLTNVDWKSFTDAFSKTGDIGAATKIVFEAKKIRKQATLFEKPLTILEVRRSLETIAETSGYGSRERKERLLETLLGEATPLEAKYIVKILIGEMRTGFHEGLMELAVSKAFSVPHDLVRRASMLTGDIGEVAAIAKTQGREGIVKLQFQVFRPIKPMLAQTADAVDEAIKEHGGETAFEHKLDGARVQIHKSKDTVRIYSRRLTDVTDSFPEIVRLIRNEVKAGEAILEGEIIAVGENGYPLPFQHIMRRFRRVHDIEEMIEKIPVELYLFDLIYLNGQSLIADTYVERRKKLEKTAGGILLTKQIITGNPREAERFLKEAIENGHEGLVAKKLDSPYTLGIRGKRWFKIKESLESLDLVVVAAEYGYGRRHNWLSDYYLAARDLESGEFLVVGKTFKGLTDEEIIEMTKRLKELTIKEEYRRVVVTPRIVVEVAYNEIQKSPKYKCGMALRFARITRIRDDKSPEEADTIQRVRKIYEKQFEKKAKYQIQNNKASLL